MKKKASEFDELVAKGTVIILMIVIFVGIIAACIGALVFVVRCPIEGITLIALGLTAFIARGLWVICKKDMNW